MKNKEKLLKLVTLAMLVALGVVISPILRVEGMCPMAHFINIVCSVLLGPWYSLLCATLIGVIRMAFMGIPPLALTGAVFGAFLSGVFYRLSKGRIIFAVLGEVIGTGIISIPQYSVMLKCRSYPGDGQRNFTLSNLPQGVLPKIPCVMARETVSYMTFRDEFP